MCPFRPVKTLLGGRQRLGFHPGGCRGLGVCPPPSRGSACGADAMALPPCWVEWSRGLTASGVVLLLGGCLLGCAGGECWLSPGLGADPGLSVGGVAMLLGGLLLGCAGGGCLGEGLRALLSLVRLVVRVHRSLGGVGRRHGTGRPRRELASAIRGSRTGTGCRSRRLHSHLAWVRGFPHSRGPVTRQEGGTGGQTAPHLGVHLLVGRQLGSQSLVLPTWGCCPCGWAGCPPCGGCPCGWAGCCPGGWAG